MDKAKVLIISGSFYGMECGVGEYLFRLSIAIARNGPVELFILTSKEAVPLKDMGFHLLPLINRWGFLSYKKIKEAIGRVGPCIVHIQYPTIRYNKPYSIAIVFLPLMIKLFFPKIRVVTSIHDFSIGHIFSRIKQLPILALSDIILISNERDRDGMLKLFSHLRDKIKKVRIGSNIAFKEIEEREKTAIKKALSPSGERSIAYFGFLTKGRRIDLLMASFKKLTLDRCGLRCRLVIIGKPQTRKDLSLISSLKGLAKRLKIDHQVLWIEEASDEEVSKYLQCMDLCVLPFERGADLRRTTLISCVTHGLPIITTINKRYLADIELSQMGIVKLIDLNKDDLAHAIEDLLKDTKARESMIYCMQQVKDRFSWDDIAKEHLHVYEALI